MKKLLFVTFIAVILLSSCDWLFEDDTGGKRFWAQNFSTNSFYQLYANLLAENEHCKVYAETTSGVSKSVAQNMANEFLNIYDKMIGAFGLEFEGEYTNGKKYKLNTIKLADAYCDGDGKLTILLLDIRDSYQKGVNESYVAGYFTPINFFSDDPKSGYRSNLCDMIYIDTNPALKEDPEDAYSTLAHELQHLMNFTTTLEKRSETDAQGQLADLFMMDTWIDEGLASAAEYVYAGEHLIDRWGWYYLNGDGNGLIDKGNNFFVWGNRDHDESCGRADKGYPDCKDPANHSQYAILDDYATVYLFFQWLRIQSSKDVGIYKDIIGYEVKPADKNTYSENSYLPVTEAVSKSIDSSYKGKWGDLLRDWLAANYIYAPKGDPNSLYGYKDDFNSDDFKNKDGELLTIKGRNLLYTEDEQTTVKLYPGEGVFSKIDTAYATANPSKPADTTNIKYYILTDSPKTTMAQGALLTYNANPANFTIVNNAKKDPTTEQGTVTGVPVAANVNIAAPVNGRAVAGGFTITGPYRIGAGDVRRGGVRGLPPIDILQLPSSLMLRE